MSCGALWMAGAWLGAMHKGQPLTQAQLCRGHRAGCVLGSATVWY